MSLYVGFVFTEWPLKDLVERGFRFHEDRRGHVEGFHSFTVVFPDSTGFQIREILDEASYRKAHPIDHFSPFVMEETYDLSPSTQYNSVLGVREGIVESKMENCELKTFLEIRKPFSPWALWLKCQDFDLFCRRARPDRLFRWKDQPMALIHLGPNCFDLLVSADLA